MTETRTTDFAKMSEDLRLARVDPPAHTEWSVWVCDGKGRPDNPLSTHQTEEEAQKAAETRRLASLAAGKPVKVVIRSQRIGRYTRGTSIPANQVTDLVGHHVVFERDDHAGSSARVAILDALPVGSTVEDARGRVWRQVFGYQTKTGAERGKPRDPAWVPADSDAPDDADHNWPGVTFSWPLLTGASPLTIRSVGAPGRG